MCLNPYFFQFILFHLTAKFSVVNVEDKNNENVKFEVLSMTDSYAILGSRYDEIMKLSN